MKKHEWVVIPLMGISVGLLASIMGLVSDGMRLDRVLAVYDSESGSPGLLVVTALSLIFLIYPGLLADFFFRKYPERVRLSPFAFGLIPIIPLALIPDMPSILPFLAGSVIMVFTIPFMCTFKPGKRLGEFEPIPFRKTVLPFLLSGVPLWLILVVLFLFSRTSH